MYEKKSRKRASGTTIIEYCCWAEHLLISQYFSGFLTHERNICGGWKLCFQKVSSSVFFPCFLRNILLLEQMIPTFHDLKGTVSWRTCALDTIS